MDSNKATVVMWLMEEDPVGMGQSFLYKSCSHFLRSVLVSRKWQLVGILSIGNGSVELHPLGQLRY